MGQLVGSAMIYGGGPYKRSTSEGGP